MRLVPALGLAAVLALPGPKALLAGPAGPAAPPTRLKVLYVRFLSFAPLAIARAEGYFRAQGLDVELVTLPGSHEATPALISGELDVTAGMLKIGDFNAIARGASIRFVADKGHLEPGPCVPAAFVARRGSLDPEGPDGRDRLGGARIAASPLSFVEYMLETLLARQGLTLSDVKLARLHEAMVGEAVTNGSLDVGELTEPYLSRTIRSGRAVDLEVAPGDPSGSPACGRLLRAEPPERTATPEGDSSSPISRAFGSTTGERRSGTSTS